MACWNYCEGVPAHELENMESSGDYLRGIFAQLAQMEKERDALKIEVEVLNEELREVNLEIDNLEDELRR